MNIKINNENFSPKWVLVLSLIIIALFTCNTVSAAELDWPSEIFVPEGKIVIYQPQLESFEDDNLTARAAVSITNKGETEPVFGTVWLKARVIIDRNTRIVKLLDIDVTNSRFPHADPAKKEKLAGIIKEDIPKWNPTMSLDRLLTMIELVEKEKTAAKDFKTIPPKIIYVTHPAVLITIDGDPELRKIENSNLMRVINTPFYIVLEPTSKNYYLKGSDGWFAARDIMGPWQNEPKPPPSVLAAASSEFNDKDKEKSDGSMPQIVVTTTPAELIITDGEPKYKPVSGTSLLSVSNTESDLFMEIETQKYFVLISGRWFSSASLTGSWSFVSADKLPADFAEIPPGSDKAHVMASVAGTAESKDAVFDTYIPQTVTVKRDDEVKVVVEYDGTPEFKKIEGTSMFYAVNTPYSVIRIGDTYYLCDEAVWYTAGTPSGPWAVSVSVPQVIYTIPPSYPVYNVTYVRVYDYTPTVVYVGYYPGYYGSYVYRGTVVYGTGYVYRGWYGNVYYARPVTWGYSVRYNPYIGGWGVRVGYPAPGVWFGRSALWAAGRYARWDYHRDRYDDRRDRYDDRRDRHDDRRDRKSDRREDGPKSKERRAGTDKKRQNNVYSDRNGNVHKKTDQGWKQRDKGGWSKADSSRSGSGRSDLNRDYKARERGAQRSKSYSQHSGSRNKSRSKATRSSGSRGRSGGSRGRR